MKKTILTVTGILLTFALLFSFAGCSYFEEDEEETSVYSTKTDLPTDITSSYDEESHIVTDTTYSAEKLEENKIVIFGYFKEQLNNLKSQKAAVKMYQDKRIGNATTMEGEEEISLPYSDNEYINVAISNLDSYMLHNDEAQAEYGDDLTDFLPIKGDSVVNNLDLDDIDTATCYVEENIRTITVTLKDEAFPEAIDKAYDKENVDDVMKEFEKAEDYLSVSDPELTYKNCSIVITTDIETDQVLSIQYNKSVDVKVNVTGEGKFADIGTVPVIFNYANTITYEIDSSDPATSTTLAEK